MDGTLIPDGSLVKGFGRGARSYEDWYNYEAWLKTEVLPPGIDPASLVTIAHVVNGKPVGGFTWSIKHAAHPGDG